MKTIIHPIVLSPSEREKMRHALTQGRPSEVLYANILLMSDQGITPQKIVETLHTTKQTVNNAKRKYFELGIDKYLARKSSVKGSYRRKLPTDIEAKIVALAQSEPPEGHKKWDFKLLAATAVELKYIDKLTYMRASFILRKNNIKLT